MSSTSTVNRVRAGILAVFAIGLTIFSAQAAIASLTGASSASGSSGEADYSNNYVPGEVIVRYEASSTPGDRTEARDDVDADIKRTLPLPKTQLLKLEPGQSVAAAVKELKKDPNVKYAQPNYVFESASVPNDPQFQSMWSLDNPAAQSTDIDAPQAWDTTTGSSSVKVMVVDSGVDYTHPDLAANIWSNPGESGTKATNGLDDDGNGKIDDLHGWDYQGNDGNPMPEGDSHGTNVAGTIGAVGNNGIGVTGVNWNTSIIGYRYDHSSASLVDAAAYAGKVGASIVNMSLFGGDDFVLADAFASQPNVLFLAAAGNDGKNRDAVGTYAGAPCAIPLRNIICVAATDANGDLASYSGYGTTSVDVAAPSGDVTTYPGGTYGGFGGTSQATPVAAGVAALVKSFRPSADVNDLRAAVLGGASENFALSGLVATGATVNARGALETVGSAGGQVSASQTSGRLTVSSAPGVANDMTITYDSGTLEARVHDAAASVSAGQNCTQDGSDAVCALNQNLARVSLADGNDKLTVVGSIASEINGGPGNDTITGGAATDRIIGGTGADTMRGGAASDIVDYTDHSAGVTAMINETPTSGTTGAGENDDIGLDVEQLVGTAYNDVLTGSSANNVVDGQGGVNQINGGAGNDTLRGGWANDTFAGGDGADVVDYSNHLIWQVTAIIGTTSGNGSSQISESDSIGSDVEGLTGSYGNDHLVGNAGAGVFNGSYGDDYIDAGLGADTVGGGRGVDTVDYSSRTAGVSVDATVTGGDGQAGENDTIPTTVETILGTNFADTIVTGAGDNTIQPGAGKDVIKGGSGMDTVLYGDHTASLNLSNDGAANDGVSGEQDNIDPDIEILTASYMNDVITGGTAADVLIGGDGDDVFNGNDGNDTFIGGNGTDSYNGGAGSDVVSYEDYSSWSGVQASLDGAQNDGPGQSENIGSTVEGIVGSKGDDVLTGSSSMNRISGGLGTDSIDGGGGNDDLEGDIAAIGISDSQGEVRCEAAEMGSTDTIHGGDGDDVIRGVGYIDHLYGDAGDDRFFGGSDGSITRMDGRPACVGEDFVGAGDDTYGDDFHGGSGADTVDYSSVLTYPTNWYPQPMGVRVTIDDVADDGRALEAGGYANDNVGSDVENVIGSEYIDNITGSSAANNLDGRGEADAITGGHGADTLIGGWGDDRIYDQFDNGPDFATCGEGFDIATLNVGDSADSSCEGATYAPAAIDTILDSRPPDFTSDNTLTFTFHPSSPATGYNCEVDNTTYVGCGSPWTTDALSDGVHNVIIFAWDANGSDPTPLQYTITVDTVAPNTTISSGPAEGSTVPLGDQQFGFASSESNSTFECKIDAGNWASCSSPRTVSGLTAGSHQFLVRAIDQAGNVDGSPATRNFTIGSEGAAALTVGAPVAPAASVALSTEGTYDWAHWGATAANSFNVRGTSPGDRISNYSLTGSGGTVTRATFTSPTFTWSGGSPTATGSTGSGIYIGGAQNRGFAITAPASSGQARVLKLYVAAQNTTGGLTFSMSDGSVNASAASLAVGSTLTHRVYTVTYRSNSASSTLRAEWKQTTTASSGRVYLEAATVAAVADLTPGDTTISSGPAEGSTITTPTTSFAFAISGDTASTVPGYLCKLDAAAYAPCSSPFTTPTLTDGTHAFSVKSVDQNGNVDSSPATRNFTLAIPPTKLQIGTISTTPSSVNLTSAGPSGWAHWGTNSQLLESSYFTPTRMNNVSASVISNVSKVGSSATAARVTSSVPSYSWSNGPSGSPSATALSIGGASGRGFRVTLAGASGAERTAYLYLGVINTTGKLDLSLSDGSAPAASTTALTAGSTVAHYVVPVTYRATNGSATLSATLTQNTTASSGRVYLESVALAP